MAEIRSQSVSSHNAFGHSWICGIRWKTSLWRSPLSHNTMTQTEYPPLGPTELTATEPVRFGRSNSLLSALICIKGVTSIGPHSPFRILRKGGFIVTTTLSTQQNDRTISGPMDHLRGLLHNEHIYSNLAGPVLGHRVDHRERRTGGPRPLIGMFNSMSLRRSHQLCLDWSFAFQSSYTPARVKARPWSGEETSGGRSRCQLSLELIP